MKIIIATGIYPPEVGGPAQYAKNLSNIWKGEGHSVFTNVFSLWNFLPTGLRHFVYFCSMFPDVIWTDFVLVLDTFSSALPALLAAKICRKKIILRTGGDFLWELYVERTGDLVLLRDFYDTCLPKFSFKERIIFKTTKWILKNQDAIIWSTEWQKDIFMKPYGLHEQNNFVIENFYGPRVESFEPKAKNFIFFTRILKWKNIDFLKKVFARDDVIGSGAILDTAAGEHSKFLEAIKNSYGVIITSLGDVSPNTILDAIRCQKPFILTKENGLTPRIKDIGLFVDPKNEDDVAKKIIWLCNDSNYLEQKKKIMAFDFVHTWEEIAREYMEIYNKINEGSIN